MELYNCDKNALIRYAKILKKEFYDGLLDESYYYDTMEEFESSIEDNFVGACECLLYDTIENNNESCDYSSCSKLVTQLVKDIFHPIMYSENIGEIGDNHCLDFQYEIFCIDTKRKCILWANSEHDAYNRGLLVFGKDAQIEVTKVR